MSDDAHIQGRIYEFEIEDPTPNPQRQFKRGSSWVGVGHRQFLKEANATRETKTENTVLTKSGP